MVAIKCVAKKSLNKASVENLLTEIEILKGIRHPHIVQLKDFQVWAWGGAHPRGAGEGTLSSSCPSASNHSGTMTTSTSSWSSVQEVTCLASSTPAGFYQRRWLGSSCSNWVKASDPSLTLPVVSALPLHPCPRLRASALLAVASFPSLEFEGPIFAMCPSLA